MNIDIPVVRSAPRSRMLGCAPYLVVALLLSGMAPATLRRLTTESLRTAYEANGRDPWTAFGIAKRYEEDGDLASNRYFALFLKSPAIRKADSNQFSGHALRALKASDPNEYEALAPLYSKPDFVGKIEGKFAP